MLRSAVCLVVFGGLLILPLHASQEICESSDWYYLEEEKPVESADDQLWIEADENELEEEWQTVSSGQKPETDETLKWDMIENGLLIDLLGVMPSDNKVGTAIHLKYERKALSNVAIMLDGAWLLMKNDLNLGEFEYRKFGLGGGMRYYFQDDLFGQNGWWGGISAIFYWGQRSYRFYEEKISLTDEQITTGIEFGHRWLFFENIFVLEPFLGGYSSNITYEHRDSFSYTYVGIGVNIGFLF